jgi:undecaprenyl diphosphate synthase
MHDPELLIRTGGERRFSNYLLWQLAETELLFSEELWPEFSRGSFEAAIEEFRERRRRGAGEAAGARKSAARQSGEALTGH